MGLITITFGRMYVYVYLLISFISDKGLASHSVMSGKQSNFAIRAETSEEMSSRSSLH